MSPLYIRITVQITETIDDEGISMKVVAMSDEEYNITARPKSTNIYHEKSLRIFAISFA